MPKKIPKNDLRWVDSELRLAGLDSRMIGLLSAIEQSGSINQAAKIMGLSYKGAWQMIERANLLVPKGLIVTATGGSRGGGTYLSETGKTLLKVFNQLEQRNSEFIKQLNDELSDNPDVQLLLQKQVIKASACNQLFGTIDKIIVGAVNVEVIVKLKGGTQITSSISLSSMTELGIKYGAQAVLMINSADITVAVDIDPQQFSARNRLSGKIIRLQQDEVNAEIIVRLPDGELLRTLITQQSVIDLGLKSGLWVWLIFKINVPILGVIF